MFDGIFGGVSPLVNIDDSDDDMVPKAYLNYIVFDKHMVFQRFGFSQVTEVGNGAHEQLTLNIESITNAGFVYIYISNETNADLNVFFDDFEVTHEYAPIAISTDYYPFGMTMESRSYAREDYRFGYQGEFAEKDEETGWNAFELRMYDPKIGRWMSTDPYGQFYSPYVGMGNAPNMATDPDGGFAGGAIELAGITVRALSYGTIVSGATAGLSAAASAMSPLDWYLDLETNQIQYFEGETGYKEGYYHIGEGNQYFPSGDGRYYYLPADGSLPTIILHNVTITGDGTILRVMELGSNAFFGHPVTQGVLTLATSFVPVGSIAKGVRALGGLGRAARGGSRAFKINPVKLTTSSRSLAPSRTYSIYQASGQLYKFGVSDANLARYSQSLIKAGPGAYGKFSSIMPKKQAHIMEKYLRSLHYNSTGIRTLPGMKIPYPRNLWNGSIIR